MLPDQQKAHNKIIIGVHIQVQCQIYRVKDCYTKGTLIIELLVLNKLFYCSFIV